jgi:hypothetical protein
MSDNNDDSQRFALAVAASVVALIAASFELTM